MKRVVLWGVIGWVFLFAQYQAWGSFPSVPKDAALYPVQHFSDTALLYAWAEGGKVYVHFKLISDEFFACGQGFGITQGDTRIDGLNLLNEAGGIFCSTFSTDQTFELQDPLSRFDPNEPFTLVFSADEHYELQVAPMPNQPLVPEDGVWQDTFHILSFYLQTYTNYSAAIVATMNGVDNVVFLDPNYLDGIKVSNDLGNQGYTWNLILRDRVSGVVVADLPGGRVIYDVSLVYPASE